MGRKYIDLTGQTFSKLYVERFSHVDKGAYWHCICRCGNKLVTTSGNLRSGDVKSCSSKWCKRHRKDLVGLTFGNWYVESVDRVNSTQKQLRWSCLCKCGARKPVLGASLRGGTSTSCGPSCVARGLRPGVKDLTGMTFGKLVVESFAYIKKVGTKNCTAACWNCRCECGQTRVFQGSILRGGHAVSCSSKCTLSTGIEAPKHGVYLVYRCSAKRRQLTFELTKEQCIQLFNKECYYCGAHHSNEKSSKVGAIFKYNGIDRVDSRLGYTITNTVPCCCHCNRAKLAMTQQSFIILCHTVANRHPIKGEEHAGNDAQASVHQEGGGVPTEPQPEDNRQPGSTEGTEAYPCWQSSDVYSRGASEIHT